MPDFVNREEELEVLRRHLDSPSPALFVLYGRRRTGKSALLRRVCAGRRHVYFTADLGSRQDQLRSFATALGEGLGEADLAGTVPTGWEAALRLCLARARAEALVLVLDEFQHLASGDPSLASVLQRLWDSEMAGARLSIVLCGSYVGFMEREVLGARNPLYGRRTGQLVLEPLALRHAGLFFADLAPEARMERVAILGGVPAYLRLFDPMLDLETSVIQTILAPGGALFDEPRFLMMEELREPAIYFSICRAIAHGNTRPNEIAQAAGLGEPGRLPPYLATLREMRLVERQVPPSIRNPERSRRGLHRLRDPFLRFWFRFALPHRTQLESGDARLVWRRKVAPHLAQHVGQVFEDACLEHLRLLNRRGELANAYDRIGGWWRESAEVDVVAVADDGPLLLAECKWSERPVGPGVLDELAAKVPRVASDLERPPTRVDLAIFSRAGFTPALERTARTRGARLFTVADVLG